MWDTTIQYQPIQDPNKNVIESAEDYAQRMNISLLPNWPKEVLVEWLHRHANCIHTYAFLKFETFFFSKELWLLNEIPGRSAFKDETFCDSFSNVEERAQSPDDWLANYMLKKGTWNTPIVLLHNKTGQFVFPGGEPLKKPFHLLEGHRRLSFLNGLRKIGKARTEHQVWVVTKPM